MLPPEEQVRQQLIKMMTGSLGYPKSLLVVEKALHSLPHLATENVSCPPRRLDLLCFAPDLHPKHPLYPLLLVECKAVPLTDKVKNQVVGYNHFVGAYFVAIANQNEIQVGFLDRVTRQYVFQKGLPSYQELLNSIV